MADIEFDFTEFKAFNERVNKTGDTLSRIMLNEGLRRLGRLIVGPLKAATPVVTGKLRNSTVFQIIGGAMKQALEIRQAAQSPEGVYYGYIVREGRGPVFAKTAKALHFFIDGQEFFRKSVGPAEANPYHRRVMARLMPQIQRIVNDMGEHVTASISGKGKY